MRPADAPLILVAEDDPLMLDLISTRLRLANYWTTPARDGWEAHHRILELKPKAILLDVNLPGLNGFDILRQLKENRTAEVGPIMMLTARNSESDLRQALSLGAKDYLTKPFEDANLLRRVARLVSLADRRPAQRPAFRI
jgi:DNA-binding response OmpR family regulator